MKAQSDVRCVSNPADWKTEYAIDLAKKHRDELGAVHCGVITGILAGGKGELYISHANDDPVSMLLTRHKLAGDPRCMPIIAAAVQADARRLAHGLALVEHVADLAFRNGRCFLQAVCREDLPSNHFWSAAGFHAIAVRTNGASRSIPCIVWRKQIADMSTPLERIEQTLRLRGGGGRFLSDMNFAGANHYSQDPADIAEALAESGIYR